ncbi:MAG: hypothetical protein M1840_007336 [Geoglossum simile]|nr:MAG: hypothetical protein M1840_007336 [Geoglossum simile]
MSAGSTPAFAYPQPVSSAWGIPSAPVLPSPISFLFQVSDLRVDYNHHMPRADGPPGNWLPPDNREPFEITYGPLYSWEDGKVNSLQLPGNTPADIRYACGSNMVEHSTASAFFQQQTGKMLTVPFNVAEVNFTSTPYDWRTIGFSHREVRLAAPGGVGNLSILDFTGEERLAAPGSTPWVGELLPTVYDYYRSPTPGATTPVSAGLCGKLCLVLALLAFSCTRDRVDRVLRYSFKRGFYQAHGSPTGRM